MPENVDDLLKLKSEEQEVVHDLASCLNHLKMQWAIDVTAKIMANPGQAFTAQDIAVLNSLIEKFKSELGLDESS